MAEGRMQMLTHRTEAMVWQPRWLSHPNGALALASVMIAVSDADSRKKVWTERLETNPSSSISMISLHDQECI
jgi:hypothetical protein